MKLPVSAILASFLVGGDAFQVAPPQQRNGRTKSTSFQSAEYPVTGYVKATTVDEDCGCGGAEILSGEISEAARALNPRDAIRAADVYRVSGEPVSMDELMDKNKLSIVVFLRSLG